MRRVLGLIRLVGFLLPIGSYWFLAADILRKSVLMALAAVTVTTFTVAAKLPKLSIRGVGGAMMANMIDFYYLPVTD